MKYWVIIMQSGTPTHCRTQNLHVKLSTKPKLSLLIFITLICEKSKKQTKMKSFNSKRKLDLRLTFVINKSQQKYFFTMCSTTYIWYHLFQTLLKSCVKWTFSFNNNLLTWRFNNYLGLDTTKIWVMPMHCYRLIQLYV